jgi:hypothetical protein
LIRSGEKPELGAVNCRSNEKAGVKRPLTFCLIYLSADSTDLDFSKRRRHENALLLASRPTLARLLSSTNAFSITFSIIKTLFRFLAYPVPLRAVYTRLATEKVNGIEIGESLVYIAVPLSAPRFCEASPAR